MKKNITLLIIPALFIISCNDAEQPPKAIEEGFNRQYPNAQVVAWEKEDEGEWEVEFTLDGHEQSAVFDQSGKRKVHKSHQELADLPQGVSKRISTALNGYEIEEIERMETDAGEIQYEVEAGIEDEEYEIIFDAEGNELSREED
jgi:hypothetical protein